MRGDTDSVCLWSVDPVTWQTERREPSETDELSSDGAPKSVYAAFATWYGRRVVRLEHHLDRLADSARRVGIDPPDLLQLRRTLAALLEESDYPEARIRVTLSETRGSGLGPLTTVTVQMSRYEGPPVELRESGVACGLLRGATRETPEAKQTAWIAERERLIRHSGREYYEWLIADRDGAILEGASSNFYLLIPGPTSRADVLRTAGTGVLAGTARAIVLEVATERLELQLQPPNESDLALASEAFLTSASRGVIPVTSVEETVIGAGAPGPMTRWLTSAYERRAQELATPLSPAPD